MMGSFISSFLLKLFSRILAALIHKERPKLIDFDALLPENKQENLKLVFDAAEKYFGLEKYLSPEGRHLYFF